MRTSDAYRLLQTPRRPGGWTRLSCSHCNEPTWRKEDTPSGKILCPLCVVHPEHAQPCGVCFEHCRPFARPCTAKGLDMRAKHPVCRTCLGSWIATCLEDGRHEVKCPNGDCTACLPDSSLRTLASSEQWESLLDRRRDAGILRIRRMIGGAGGEDLAQWAAGKTQACPRCFALVERSEGCNHMSCRCGAQFCWVCGQWPCNKSHSRSDLPTISLPEEVEGKEDAAASRPQPQAQPEASDPAPMTAAVLRKVKSW